MKVVLGLGNPGPAYLGTRHNAGFEVVDRLADRWGVGFRLWPAGHPVSWVAERRRGGGTVLLAKPVTLMNRSGIAAQRLARSHGVEPSDFLLVYDDVDLPLGRIRVRPGGSAGGHRGVESVLEALGTEHVPRVRLGVRGEGAGGADLAAYVLDPFAEDERAVAEDMFGRGADAVEEVLFVGLERAMNRYNRSSRATARDASTGNGPQ